MKILSLTRYGEDKERIVVEFETKYGYELKIEINDVTKEITVKCNGVTVDEVLEAIETVKSWKIGD